MHSKGASQPPAYVQSRQRGNVQPTAPARPVAVESAMFMTGQPLPFRQDRSDRFEHRAKSMKQHQSHDVDPQSIGKPYSYIDEIRVTLVELDKAVKNIQMMASMAKSFGLLSLLSSSGSGSSSQTGLLGLLKSIDMKQVQALMKSPTLRKLVTDPEFFQLFAPDTGTTPGTKVDPPGENQS